MKSTSTAATPPPAAQDGLAIAVVGMGYVGLVTATCLASFGHRVVGCDIDADKVERLAAGEVPIHEDGLEALLREQLRAGRLHFVADVGAALEHADVAFVAVGTPRGRSGAVETGALDLVVEALQSLASPPSVVVLKSTLPIGTAQSVQSQLAQAHDAQRRTPVVLSNPEFLREGSAVHDFLHPDRIVVGDDQIGDAARRKLLRVYARLTADGVPVLTMDTRSAELCKSAANAMLAARISLINELAGIALATGADIERVREGIGSDHRIGREFLRPGLGYGGSCLSKDIAALRETARRLNLRSDMLLAIERVNSRQQCWSYEALQRDVGSHGALRGLTVAVWGVAFKPGTDDVRDAPSLALLPRLWNSGVHTAIYDPVANANARGRLGDCRWARWVNSAEAALDGADALLLLTDWPEFAAIDPRRVAPRLRLRTVYDGRNALDAVAWRAAGLRIRQVGRTEGSVQTCAPASREPVAVASMRPRSGAASQPSPGAAR